MANVTVLGLGAMGSRMALNLLKAGHAVTVWNRKSGKADAVIAAGAVLAGSPRTAVSEADFVITMLRDDEASEQVWLHPNHGALAGLKESAVSIESSTLSLAMIGRLAELFSIQRRRLLDAPVAGSRAQADAAQLIYLIGGETDTVSLAKPVLEAMGSAHHHAGPVGSGMLLKLAINALFGIQVAAVAEIMGLLGKSGVDAAHAAKIIAATPVCSPAANAAMASMLSDTFPAMFPVELAEKDFGYVATCAEQHTAHMPIAAATRKVLAQAIAQSLGSENLTGIVRLYQ